MNAELDVLHAGDRLRGSMSPLRQRLLEELGSEPGSATTLAGKLGESRQRVNYHLRELEKSGFVELVELRQRRGRTERILRAKARTVVVAPAIIGEREAAGDQDRFAADTLLASAARTFDEVATQRERAEAAGKRLVTFTIEASIGFAEPSDIERFAVELGERVAELAAAYDTPDRGRAYRLVIGGHPLPATRTTPNTQTTQTEKQTERES